MLSTQAVSFSSLEETPGELIHRRLLNLVPAPGKGRIAPSPRTPEASGHAVRPEGGPWECRVRPSGLVAVVVPSGWQVSFQPQR